MVALLAALPAIFTAIRSARDLFDLGRDVVQDITGTETDIKTVKELNTLVESLPERQQQEFVERMREEIDFYQKISERLLQQGGTLDRETLKSLDLKTRSKVAILRMTTRPWTVRWMVVAVVFPPLASLCVNMALSLYNLIGEAYFVDFKTVALLDLNLLANDFYVHMVGWASAIIMTYMGMRELGKAAGHADQIDLLDIKSSILKTVSSFKNIFK